MAPGPLWGDSGDAQVRVLTGAWNDPRDLARSHVSYYAAARLVHQNLGVSAATAANAVAAIAGAVTVANVCVLIGLLVPSWVGRVAGAALLAVSHTLWQLSCGAEVMTFSTMLVSAELVLMVRFLQTGCRGWLLFAVFANGLGWTTHNLSLLTWPAYAALLTVHHRRLPRLTTNWLAGMALAWIAGAVPLLVLAVREYAELRSVWDTLRSLLVGVYAEEVFAYQVTGSGVLRVLAYVTFNFPTPLVLLAPWGWMALRRTSAPGVWLFLSVAAATYALFGARYRVPDQYTFLVHAYLFAALFVAAGIGWWCGGGPSRFRAGAVLALSLCGPLLYAWAPTAARSVPRVQRWLPDREIPYRDAYAWFLQPWRAGDDGAARFAREVLKSLPDGAILFADSTTRRPIDYVQATENVRPDVQLVGSKWRPRADLVRMNADDVAQFVADGRLFCVGGEPGYVWSALALDRYVLSPAGLVSRVEFAGKP